MKTISRKVKCTREGLGYTQDKLSELSGVSRLTISEIENDRHSNTTIFVLCELCKALGVTPNDLIPEEMYK